MGQFADLPRTIALAGGVTNYAGYVQRLQSLVPNTQFVCSNNPFTSIWKGAQILSQQANFLQSCIQ